MIGPKMFGTLTRRSIFVLVIGVLALAGPPIGTTSQAAESDPSAFITSLGTRAIDIMKSKSSTTFAQREAAFRALLEEGFHLKTISRFVIGKYWKDATDAQKQAYDAIFFDFLTRVYASRFEAYSGQTFEVVQTVQESGGDQWVRTRILGLEGGQAIAVDYRVRQFDGQFKVVDVVVEGISMLNTHRVEFASVVNKRGFDGLIAELKARLEQPVGQVAGQTGG
jgi:phospholipid transport system substrate-binding protein